MKPGYSNIPPIFGVETLSALLKKSPASIFADRSRAPHRIPPSCEPPGTQKPLWLLEDVLNWLRQHQRPAAQSTAKPGGAPAAPAPRRGRPTKAEQIARQQARLRAAAREGGEV